MFIKTIWILILKILTTVNSCLVDSPLMRTLAITDKIQIGPAKATGVWLEMTAAITDSRYYRT